MIRDKIQLSRRKERLMLSLLRLWEQVKRTVPPYVARGGFELTASSGNDDASVV